jgi:antirestriction protein ArdC
MSHKPEQPIQEDINYLCIKAMKSKSEQEQRAVERQAELLSDALTEAYDASGYWLNTALRTMPRIYPKGPSISPFNLLMLNLFTEKNGYRTSQYTFFQDAKSRGEAVREKEHGVPFNWYNWNKYINLHNPQDTITRDQYLLLSPEDKKMYKGIHNREIRILFNIDQTMLPQVDKEKYEQLLDRYGSILDRGYIKGEEHQLHNTVNQFVRQMKEHLVPIRKDATSMAYYNTEKDVIYMPDQKYYVQYEDYVQELMRQLVSSTGHQQRLAREGMVMKGGRAPSGDAMKYERLVVEVASGIKMLELSTRGCLAQENLPLIDYWKRELKENPHLIDTLESDVNNALEVIRRAEKGEKIEYATLRNQQQTVEMLEKQKPQVDSKECAILLDIIRQGGMTIADGNFVSLPEKAAFLEKFNLEHYEEQKKYAFEQTVGEDSEVVETAYTEALLYAARIEDACREYLPNEWNANGHYLIANLVKNIPNQDNRMMAIVKDSQSGIVDVVMPAGALGGGQVVLPSGSSRSYKQTPDEVMSETERALQNTKVKTNDVQGFSKQRIEKALMKDGATYVRFFNNDGLLGYRPDDSYFAGKDLAVPGSTVGNWRYNPVMI